MKTILVPPPLITYKPEDSFPVFPPLGLMSIATVAQGKGHDVAICDLNFARRRGDIPETHDWHHAAADYILSLRPELIGFGTMCSSFPATILICQELKAQFSSLKVIMGGPQATMVCRDLLSTVPEIDYILTGEADFSFMEFLDTFDLTGNPMAPGLAYRKDGNVFLEPVGSPVDLDALPMINYDTWPFREAIEKGWHRSSIPIDAGRGCPYNCSFCSTNRFFRRTYRIKSPAKLKKEVRTLSQKFGINSFNLTHDSFTTRRSYVIAVARSFADSQIPHLKWVSSARVDTVDHELLTIMKESGCTRLFFGIETGSARMQKKINKCLDIGKIELTLSQAFELGFGFTVSLIIGFPDEEWRDVEATLRLLLRWSGIERIMVQLHVLAPQAGTAILEKFRDQLKFDAWFPDPAYFNQRCPTPEIEFAQKHPMLCPQCYYIPNDKVERKKLVELRELVFLLVHTLPGIGPFLFRTEKTLVDLVNRWCQRCALEGIHLPNDTGFFYVSENKIPYVRVLLDEIRMHTNLNEMQKSFLAYWETILDMESEAEVDGVNHLSEDTPFEKIEPDQELIPVLKNKCMTKTMNYNVDRSLQDWIKNGIWKWPEKRKIHYLFVRREENIEINEVSGSVAAIFHMCNGNRSLSQIYSLLQSVSDKEIEAIRYSMGAAELLGQVLGILREIAGLGLTVRGMDSEKYVLLQ